MFGVMILLLPTFPGPRIPWSRRQCERQAWRVSGRCRSQVTFTIGPTVSCVEGNIVHASGGHSLPILREKYSLLLVLHSFRSCFIDHIIYIPRGLGAGDTEIKTCEPFSSAFFGHSSVEPLGC